MTLHHIRDVTHDLLQVTNCNPDQNIWTSNQKVIGSIPIRSIPIFSSEPPVSLTENHLSQVFTSLKIYHYISVKTYCLHLFILIMVSLSLV